MTKKRTTITNNITDNGITVAVDKVYAKDLPKNPYAVKSVLESAILAVRSEVTSFQSIVLFVSKQFRPKDIAASIALKHWFLENGIPCTIYAEKDEFRKRINIPKWMDEVSSYVPDAGTFVAIAIGVTSSCYLHGNGYEKTYLFFSICGDFETDKKGVAAKNEIDDSVNHTVEIMYPEMKEVSERLGLVLSENVLTELYLALLYARKVARHVEERFVLTIRDLIDDGADADKAALIFDSLPVEVIKCINLLTNRITICSGYVKCIISHDEIPEGTDSYVWEKTLRMFEPLETVDYWILYLEFEPGIYTVLLQSKRTASGNVSSVARKNNGIGDIHTGKCIVYQFDLDKVDKNFRELVSHADV